MAPTNLGFQLETMIRGAHSMMPANSSIPTAPLSGPDSFLSTSRNSLSKHMHLVREVVSSITLQGNKYTGPKNSTIGPNPSTPHGFDVNDMIDLALSFFTVALMVMFILGLIMLAFHAADFVHSNGYTRELRVLSVRRQNRRRQLRERRDFVSKLSAEFSLDVDIEAGQALASDSLETRPDVPSYGTMDSS
jgi:hypothetical protein